MISSSAPPNFAWTAATPLSGPSAGTPNSALNASADSFQNIFANAAAQPQFALANPVLSAASSVGSNMAANWTTQSNDDTETASDNNAVSAPASDNYSASEPASATDSNSPLTSWQSSNPGSSGSTTGLNSAGEPAQQPSNSAPSSSSVASGSSDSAKAKSHAAARNSQVNTKANTKADKKVDQQSQTQQVGTNTAATGGVVGRAAVLPEAAASARAADHATADRRPDVQQTASLSDSTTRTASPGNALPGSANPLAGAAFALHITPTNNHSDATPKTASTAGAVQAAPTVAAVATPADNALSDPASVVGGAIDPAGLQVGATLIANAVSGRSRQISALGPSLGSANAAPWSAQTSSPAPLDDKAEPTESVAAATPIAEIDMDDPTGAAQTVRTLQLQLGGTGDQRVDLRLVEHAGGLSVSVRASDSSLTRGLQDNLPELSSRLAAEQYQTQTWLPAAGQTSAEGHSSGSSEQSPDQGGGRQSSQDGSSSGGQGGSHPDRQQDEAPAWWRQMAALHGAPASASTSVPK